MTFNKSHDVHIKTKSMIKSLTQQCLQDVVLWGPYSKEQAIPPHRGDLQNYILLFLYEKEIYNTIYRGFHHFLKYDSNKEIAISIHIRFEPFQIFLHFLLFPDNILKCIWHGSKASYPEIIWNVKTWASSVFHYSCDLHHGFLHVSRENNQFMAAASTAK